MPKLPLETEEKLWKDTISCEYLKLLSMLSAKKDNLMELMLLKENEEEIPMDELEADIEKRVDYHDIIFWKAL